MEEKISFVQVTLKKSSSSGKIGHDVTVCNKGLSKEKLLKRAEVALNVALETERGLEKGR